jgi:hypothetical protein
MSDENKQELKPCPCCKSDYVGRVREAEMYARLLPEDEDTSDWGDTRNMHYRFIETIKLQEK